MGVFDSIAILTPNGAVLESIQRAGPLEDGRFDPLGNWVPEPLPQRLFVDGFGLDSSGRPYFDTQQVTPGEEAALWIDPSTSKVWVDR